MYGQPQPYQQPPNQYQQLPPHQNQLYQAPQVQPPPTNQGWNPIPGNFYRLRLPWGCSECCRYNCEGYAEYELL